ncbi:MAG: LssY C-terminal domain-containing protein, partial [Gemmataceae bacterium]|nr:LssY C-terminal domain-containing protein [Gemmataceae bacterium]
KLFGAPTQELQIQWAASIDELRRALAEAGWRDAATFTPATFFNGLNPRSTPDQLPVLPHFNQDQIDRLRMIRRTAEGRWLILRFWHSGYRLRDDARPIWLGSCGRLTERQLVWTLRYTRQRNLSPENCGRIAREIAAANPSYRLIHQHAEARSAWLFYSTEADRGRDAAAPARQEP